MDLKELTFTTPLSFTFSFKKKHSYKDKTNISINSKGKISLTRNPVFFEENLWEYTFRTSNYEQQGVKEPLIFNPIKVIYDLAENKFQIKNKQNLKLLWERYRDKYRTKQNLATLLTLEKFYFHSEKGLESECISNAPFLPFFIPFVSTNFKPEQIISSLSWLSVPINLPLKTTYQCVEIDEDFIFLKGWVSLDEEAMELLLSKENFKYRAKPYHLSGDFQIKSDLKLKIRKKTMLPYKAHFEINITGENNLSENTYYELYSSDYTEKEGVYKTYKGKDYTEQEWAEIERIEWEKYKNRSKI